VFLLKLVSINSGLTLLYKNCRRREPSTTFENQFLILFFPALYVMRKINMWLPSPFLFLVGNVVHKRCTRITLLVLTLLLSIEALITEQCLHFDWLTDWLTDQPTDCLTDQPTDRLTDWLTDQPTDWLINRLTDWSTDWLTDWTTDWLINRLTDQPTDWSTDWLTNGLTDW
jgi:hypothetical protein